MYVCTSITSHYMTHNTMTKQINEINRTKQWILNILIMFRLELVECFTHNFQFYLIHRIHNYSANNLELHNMEVSTHGMIIRRFVYVFSFTLFFNHRCETERFEIMNFSIVVLPEYTSSRDLPCVFQKSNNIKMYVLLFYIRFLHVYSDELNIINLLDNNETYDEEIRTYYVITNSWYISIGNCSELYFSGSFLHIEKSILMTNSYNSSTESDDAAKWNISLTNKMYGIF